MDYTTDSLQLEDYAKILKIPLIEVLSKDELVGRPLIGAYIINMEDSTGGGTHWVLLMIFPNKDCIYFDAFGLPPPEQVKTFIGKRLAISNRPIQDIKSTTCGYWCLACAHYMSHQRRKDVYERYDDFLNIFKVDTKKNDEILLHYLKLNGLNIHPNK
jgi:hypothetical protein